MRQPDPILGLYRKGILVTLLGLVLLATLIGAVAVYPYHVNLRNQADANFSHFGEALAAQVRAHFSEMGNIARQVTSRTRARNTLIDFNQGKIDLAQAQQIIGNILIDVPLHSPLVLGVWRFDQQGNPVTGVGQPLPKGISPLPDLPAETVRFRSQQQADEKDPLIIADAPITDRESRKVGTDILLFRSGKIATTLNQAINYYPAGQITLGEGNDHEPLFAVGPAPEPGSDDRQLMSYPVEGSSLVLGISIGKDQLHALADEELVRLLAILAGLFVVGLVAVYWVGLRFQRLLHAEVELRVQREQDLQTSEKRFRSLVEHSPVPMLVVDNDSVRSIRLVNRRFGELFGFDPAQLGRLDDWWNLALADPNQRQQMAERWGRALQAVGSDEVATWAGVLHDARGEARFAEVSFGLHGQFGLIVCNDLTDRRRSEQQAQLAASVFSHASEGITITDPEGNILDVNRSFSRITGYSREEVLGRNPRMLQSGRHDASFYRALWQDLLETGHWEGEIWNRRKDGEVFAEMLSINAVRDRDGGLRHFVGLFSDVTKLKEHQQRLEHIAHYDALTGLPNRVLLADRLQQSMLQSLRRNNQLALAFLDLDGFKAINDNYGHEGGDELLIVIANRLRDTLREGDTIARLGGDEFVAVLIDISSKTDVETLLERLLEAAAQPVEIDGQVAQVSASLGVTFYPQTQPVDADQLLRQADNAMYLAKQAGKNRFRLFDAERDLSVRGHYESLARIRAALSDDELVLHYQPKVNLRTGEVIGVEALVRWQHPQRGLLGPSAFLPTIEEDPLSIDLDGWVIRTGLAQLAEWHRAGMRLALSINIGSLMLQRDDLPERIEAFLRHAGIGAEFLELEVLEGSALEDINHVSRLIDRCRDIGVRFALDDFGTGYSSLTYLKRLPASILKIDQSFVHNMLDDPDDLAILEGVLGLATAFGRDAIAEGVETEAHCDMLLRLGCDLVQGYAIAKPMEARDLPRWLEHWQPLPRWQTLKRVSRSDLSVLSAGIQHRAWVARVEQCVLQDARPPPLPVGDCPFHDWIEREGHPHYGRCDAFRDLPPLHDRIHALGQRLCQAHQAGEETAARDGLKELHRLRDELLSRLEQLLLVCASED